MALVQRVVTTIRSLRADHGVPSAHRTKVLLGVSDDYKKTILEGYAAIVAEQGRASEVLVRRAGGERLPGRSATGVAGDVEVSLSLEGLADTGAAERAKLEKERGKLVSDRDFINKKLGNPQFVERAKPEVIEKDKARLAEIESALARIDAALAR